MSVDRRSYPRYPVDFKVRIQPQGVGGEFAVDARSLSRSSVQVTCAADLVVSLVKQTQPPHVCNLAFQIPDEPQPLVLSGQVLTHRRISQQQYVLVFLFKQLGAQQASELDYLLQEALHSM